jgi:hypothetical protein
MNTSTAVIRFGLLTLLGATVLGTAALLHTEASAVAVATQTSATPVAVLDTITVRPDAGDSAALPVAVLGTITVHPDYNDSAVVADALPILPAVEVKASNAEMLAARIDPTDRIQVMGEITVRATAEELADTTNAQPDLVLGDEDRDLGVTLSRAVAEPHRLRLDMPYYSFGKILVNGK